MTAGSRPAVFSFTISSALAVRMGGLFARGGAAVPFCAGVAAAASAFEIAQTGPTVESKLTLARIRKERLITPPNAAKLNGRTTNRIPWLKGYQALEELTGRDWEVE